MVHYLRNSRNNTVVEASVIDNDFSMYVNIKIFADLLRTMILSDIPATKVNEFVADMDGLNELRGRWFEKDHSYFVSINKFLEYVFREMASKWNFDYIVD